MECQRCGQCCLFFVIVPVQTPEGVQAAVKYDNVRCPHISFDEKTGEASCAAHDWPEYEGSPCHRYGNPDYDIDYAHTRGQPCKVGELLRRHPDEVKRRYNRAETQELKLLGLWAEETP